jgi:hypothetical protein
MISKTTLAAALIALTSLAAVPANAFNIGFSGGGMNYGWGGSQHHGWNWGGDSDYGHRWRHQRLSTQEVRWILRDRGYRDIRFFDDRGPVYQLRAHKHGDTFYLVVSARSGEILSRNRI